MLAYYFIALIPLYIFIYLPLSNYLYGPPESPHHPILNLNSTFIADDKPLSCPSHPYKTYILSTDPLIIYIENFFSANESDHFVKISENKYEPSTLSHGSATYRDSSTRFSEVALIERDESVRCIEHRARSFQGWRENLYIERLRTQRYGVGGHYDYHYDWSGASREQDRVSTFMVYVKAECVGGGTRFPRVRIPRESGRWCEFLECGEEDEGKEDSEEAIGGGEDSRRRRGRKREGLGITFKPITGNAVFWHNLQPNGRGYQETYHAGLPVISGTKVGLNIWSWGSARDGSR